MPVQFAEASGGQSHVDAREILRRGQFPLRYLMGPTALFSPFTREVKGIPDRPNVTVVGRRRCVLIRVLTEKSVILGSWVTRGMVALCAGSVLALLCMGRYARHCACYQRCGSNTQETTSRRHSVEKRLLLILTAHVSLFLGPCSLVFDRCYRKVIQLLHCDWSSIQSNVVFGITIFAVLEGNITFCALIAFTTSRGDKPSDFSRDESMSTIIWRTFPP
jgi:hypothetical protein